MKEYTLAAVAVLAGTFVLTGVRGGLRDRGLWAGLVVFGVMTVVADSALIRFGVFSYDPRFRSGLGIGPMPIEDLLYGWALYLVAIAAWSWGRPRA